MQACYLPLPFVWLFLFPSFSTPSSLPCLSLLFTILLPITLLPLVFGPMSLWLSQVKWKNKYKHSFCASFSFLSQLFNSSGCQLSEWRHIIPFRMEDSHRVWDTPSETAACGESDPQRSVAALHFSHWNTVKMRTIDEDYRALEAYRALTAHKKKNATSFSGCNSGCHVCINSWAWAK